MWDLVDRACAATLKGHFSAVTSLALSPDGWHLVTGGRDKVANVWDLRSHAKVATVPVYEAIEGACVRVGGGADFAIRHALCLYYIAWHGVALAGDGGRPRRRQLRLARRWRVRGSDCCCCWHRRDAAPAPSAQRPFSSTIQQEGIIAHRVVLLPPVVLQAL